MRAVVVLLVTFLALVGCSSTPSAAPPGDGSVAAPATGTVFPDVVDARVARSGPDTVSVSATIRSPYDTPQRYADGFRARTPDGQVLGVRELVHDHASEQPFTRTLTGVRVPPGVSEVVVEGRDMVSGWGGATVTVPVPA